MIVFQLLIVGSELAYRVSEGGREGGPPGVEGLRQSKKVDEKAMCTAITFSH